MSNTKTIAALAGPMLFAIGASLLLNRADVATLAAQISNDYALIFISGGLLLLAGLAIVQNHNLWVADWRVIVTVLGWVAVVSGLLRMLFFRQLALAAPAITQWPAMVPATGIAMLALGSFLALKAFR